MTHSFESLLREFAATHGIELDDSVRGLEFDCEGVSVFIVQHPLHPDRLLAEVTVVSYDDQLPAGLLALMLQINEASRFEHDWSIVMDEAMQVRLTAPVSLAGLTVADLEALMLDGVERAQRLQAMLAEAAVAVSQTDRADSSRADPAPMLMVRA